MRNLTLVIVIAAASLAFSSSAWSQGTKDNPSSQSQGSSSRSNGSSSDTMGGAFKGTGTPNFGTSRGMGSDKNPKR